MSPSRRPIAWLVAALILAAVLLRVLAFEFLTDDVRHWVLPWYDHHLALGPAGLGRAPSNVMTDAGNYPPPFFYLLLIASVADAWLPRLYLVKLFPTLFDFVAAGAMYLIARRSGAGRPPAWLAAIAVLFAPTVVANSALWGQADSIPAAFIALSVLGVLSGHRGAAAIATGVAISFKATALFVLPFWAMLLFCRCVNWRHVAMIPLGYLAMMVPALMAGRSLYDVTTIYLRQGELYERLSMNAPNLYYFFPESWYQPALIPGLIVAAVVALLLAVSPARWRSSLTPRFLLLAATYALLVMPFVLPKMHDRYFFAVDVLSIGLVWYDRRFWYVPVLSQVSSALAYVPIISEAATGIDDGFVGLMPVAVLVNTALVALLTREFVVSGKSGPARLEERA